MEPEGSLPHSQELIWVFRKKICFYAEELLAFRPIPNSDEWSIGPSKNIIQLVTLGVIISINPFTVRIRVLNHSHFHTPFS